MVESPVRILSYGPDTFELNVYPADRSYQPEKRTLPPELVEELNQWKEQAQEENDDVPTRFVLDDMPLLMRDKGDRNFFWLLHNKRTMTIAVNRSAKMDLWAHVRISSEYLWKHRDLSIGAIASGVHIFLMSIFGEYITLQVAGLDLCVDVFGLDLGTVQHIKDSFVSRAQLDDEIPVNADEALIDGPDRIKRRWRRVTGLPFGARNGKVSAILYDKSHEIKYHAPEKSWFWDLWQRCAEEQGFCLLPSAVIWRVEVRLKRGALHEMLTPEGHGIEDPYSLADHLYGLFHYMVGHAGGGEDGLPDGWLRYVVPSEDLNRSRWPVHPDWKVIQSAFPPYVSDVPVSDDEREQQEQEELFQEVDTYLGEHPFQASNESSNVVAKKQARTTHPVVASAPFIPPTFDLTPYMRKRHRQVNQDRAVSAIVGWASTFQAWQGNGDEDDVIDISATFHEMYTQAEEYLQKKRRDYSAIVQKKRTVYAVESAA